MGRWMILKVNRAPFAALLLTSMVSVDGAVAGSLSTFTNPKQLLATHRETTNTQVTDSSKQLNEATRTFTISESKTCNGSSVAELSFQNPSKENNRPNLSEGSIYRFSNVITGIDALVTVDKFNNGATLGAIDNASTGSADALQPSLNPSRQSGDSSVDLIISFVESGTNTPKTVQAFNASGVDIDGDSRNLREYIELDGFSSYTLETPTSLTPTINASIGRFESNTTKTQPDISTDATQTLITTSYQNVSRFRYRIGALKRNGRVRSRLNSLSFSCLPFKTPETQPGPDPTLEPAPASTPPEAVDDSNTTEVDTPVDGNLLDGSNGGTDTDPDGDTLTVSENTDPTNGKVAVNPDGTYTYTPNPDFSGTDTFTYTISDGNGGTDIATVTITIPEAEAATAPTLEQKPTSKPDPAPESDPESESEPESTPEPEPTPEPKSAEAGPASESELTPESNPGSEPEPESTSEPEPETEAATAPTPEPESTSKSSPTSEPEPALLNQTLIQLMRQNQRQTLLQTLRLNPQQKLLLNRHQHRQSKTTPKQSPLSGKIVINEVLYKQTVGNANANNNDEFIELFNPSNEEIDLGGLQLIDGNILDGDIDGKTGSITGNTSPYVFPPNTLLKPGEYAVIWIGNEKDNQGTVIPEHQAPDAAFQTWLGQRPKLNNTGDDVWLYDDQNQIIDYIAYGKNTGSSTGINTPPPAALDLWDSTAQATLGGADQGQSISLTANGQDSNDSNCWEPTTSGDASTRCSGYLETIDADSVDGRVTSIAGNNNGSPDPKPDPSPTNTPPEAVDDSNITKVDTPVSGNVLDGSSGGERHRP